MTAKLGHQKNKKKIPTPEMNLAVFHPHRYGKEDPLDAWQAP
jgi:hypothetical protein